MSRCGDPRCPASASYDVGPCGACDALREEDGRATAADLRAFQYAKAYLIVDDRGAFLRGKKRDAVLTSESFHQRERS